MSNLFFLEITEWEPCVRVLLRKYASDNTLWECTVESYTVTVMTQS